MRITYAVVLGTLLVIVFLISYKKEKDLLSPLCFASMMMFIRYVPNMGSKPYENFSHLTEGNIAKLFWVEIISLAALTIGYTVGTHTRITIRSDIRRRDQVTLANSSDSKINPFIIFLLFFLGMIARLRVIAMSGGIRYITNNAAVAYISLSNGTGFLSMFSNFAIVAVMMELSLVLQDYRAENIAAFKKKRIILVLMMVVYSLTFLIFTSRSPIFELLLFVLFGINYLWRRLQIKDFLSPRILVVIIASLALIVILPMLRQGQSLGFNKNTNIFSSIFDEFSYVGRDTYVYDHFNSSNFWHGGNYKGLITAFIPYHFYPDKPPVDDGIYLANIMYGHWVSPPVPRDDLVISYSIPFSTAGILFANFGTIGVFFGELMLGIIYAKVYRKLNAKKNVLWIIIFQLVVYQLELSTLSIIQTLIPLLIAVFVYKPTTSVRVTFRK